MKKTIFSLLALCTAVFAANADSLSISPAVQIKTPAEAHHPVLSPDGSTLLFSTQDHQGLYAYNMKTKNVTLLDEGMAAGFQPVFSKDCKKVFYYTASMIDDLLYRDVRSVETASGKVKQLKKATREPIDLRSIEKSDYVTTTLKSIVIVKDGVKTEIAPISDAHSYLWPTLSPDGKKVLFNEPFQGVFICNIDGTNLNKIADKGDYPCWISDNAILVVETKDDGYVVTSSELKLMDLETGSSAVLSQEGTKVAEITTAPNTGDVVYSTIEGKMFRTNILVIR